MSHNAHFCEMEFHKLGLDNYPHEQDLDMGLIWGLWENEGTVLISEEKCRLRKQRWLGVSCHPPNTFGGGGWPVSGPSLSFCLDVSTWSFSTILE